MRRAVIITTDGSVTLAANGSSRPAYDLDKTIKDGGKIVEVHSIGLKGSSLLVLVDELAKD